MQHGVVCEAALRQTCTWEALGGDEVSLQVCEQNGLPREPAWKDVLYLEQVNTAIGYICLLERQHARIDSLCSEVDGEPWNLHIMGASN
jgi:hypothetical protein